MTDPTGKGDDGPTDTLMIAISLVQSNLALTHALFDVVVAVADRAGVSDIDGEPVGTFAARRSREHLDEMMRQTEDFSPVVAARIQMILDEISRRTGADG